MSLCTYRSAPRSETHGWANVGDTSRLSAEERRDLFLRVERGDVEARDHAIRANLGLVVSIAIGFKGCGVPMDDLIGWGNLGLIRAVELHDPHLGTKFSTYAAYWIKQSIRIGVNAHLNASHLPSYARVLATKWRRVEAQLTKSLGREPTRAEIAKALNLTKRKATTAVQTIEATKINRSRHYHTGDDTDGMMLADARTDIAYLPPDDRLVEAEELDRVVDHVDTLDERGAQVVRLRFGLGDNAPMTLREVGERLGLTRERIRQIEADALRKLRSMMDDETGAEG